MQWGGRLLCESGDFTTTDGRAQFTALSPPDTEIPEDRFAVSTRRGKQFNSMIWDEKDPLTGASRDDVLMNETDARRLDLRNGEAVFLRSAVGRFNGRVKIAPIRAGNLQVHWPESNQLLERGSIDEECGIPNYNTIVEVLPANGADSI